MSGAVDIRRDGRASIGVVASLRRIRETATEINQLVTFGDFAIWKIGTRGRAQLIYGHNRLSGQSVEPKRRTSDGKVSKWRRLTRKKIILNIDNFSIRFFFLFEGEKVKKNIWRPYSAARTRLRHNLFFRSQREFMVNLSDLSCNVRRQVDERVLRYRHVFLFLVFVTDVTDDFCRYRWENSRIFFFFSETSNDTSSRSRTRRKS